MSKQSLGWVYILTNPAFKEGMIKIGFTSRDTPQQRADELSGATGVPSKFEVAWAARMPDAQSVERTVHRLLRHKRSNSNREFFECSINEAIEMIETVAGKTIVTKMNPKKSTHKQPEKQIHSRHKQTTIKHKHRGLIGTMMTLLLLFLGAMFVVGLHVEKKETSSIPQPSPPRKSTTTLPETPKPTPPSETSSSVTHRDVEAAWQKIPPTIRETLHKEQEAWENQKIAHCAASPDKSACESEFNQARINYLRGFSIH